jgi:hypothetical protein
MNDMETPAMAMQAKSGKNWRAFSRSPKSFRISFHGISFHSSRAREGLFYENKKNQLN